MGRPTLSPALSDGLAALERALVAELREAQDRVDALTKDARPKVLEQQGVLVRRAPVHGVRRGGFGRVRLTVGEDNARRGHLGLVHAKPGATLYLLVRDDDGALVRGAQGVLTRRRRDQLEVSFAVRDDDDSASDLEEGDIVDLMVGFDEVTTRRLLQGLKGVSRSTRAATLAELLVCGTAPRATQLPDDLGASLPLSDALNDDQRLAAMHALLGRDVALVHGPPGTGKTRVLVDVVAGAVARGERVLCMTASNAAVDHLAAALIAQVPRVALTRLGDPARVDAAVEAHTLSAQIASHPHQLQAQAVVDEAQRMLRSATRRSDTGREAFQRRREARAEANSRFAEARRLEQVAVDDVISRAQVVCATLTGRTDDIDREEARFDLLVVDEASQALTPALLLPLPLLAREGRVVLAGDHQQLPPVVLSMGRDADALRETAFGRLMRRRDAGDFGHMLTVQHRMHAALMAFPSARFYDGKLVAHASVASRALPAAMAASTTVALSDRILDVIDSAGAGFDERQPEEGASYHNPGEAGVVVAVVKDLLAAGLGPEEVGVITPYSGQVAVLLSSLSAEVDAGLEIDSVDGFQGREKRVIVFSAVRSNVEGEVGFLSDARRLNVAITRAQEKLVVVGDSATLSADGTWRALFDDAIARGAYRSVFEIPGAVDGL